MTHSFSRSCSGSRGRQDCRSHCSCSSSSSQSKQRRDRRSHCSCSRSSSQGKQKRDCRSCRSRSSSSSREGKQMREHRSCCSCSRSHGNDPLPNQRITQECYGPPLPNTNGHLQQWEAHGLSRANNAFGDSLTNNADNFDAASALLGISGMYKCVQIQN